MPDDYKAELQKLLRKLFQFDVADLDFGIYRIMNQKRDVIEKFIDKDLIDAVDTEFERYETVNEEEIQEQLKTIKKKIMDTIGSDAIKPSGEIKEAYKTLPIAKEYYKKKEELENAEITDQQKAEIFSHIYQFFSRYYHEGDFLSLRRYSRQNKYAIPYNGEEVLLHWANKDQYYIKTGDYFKNYSFNVGDYKVNFRLSTAETEQNSNKSDKRYFLLKEEDGNIVFDGDNKELTLLFEYRGLNDGETKRYGTRNVQENIIGSITDIIREGIPDVGFKNALERIKDDSKKTLLEKHLTTYTKRNTTDYFIHKDLKGFLDKELDFYIKNEVLMLDELGSANEVSSEKYITRVKVIKAIIQKIIKLLAQIENFQKKLWEKKKFVVKTDYCMTLDKVPDEFYEEITQNVAQINEWKELFKLEEVEKGTLNYSANGGLKIDADYLNTHPFLVMDTKFFGQDFKDRLLSTFEDLDEAIGGIMIKSENWQALNLMGEKYREKVKCIYIDPPYNTGNDDGFIYKDNYQRSTWLAMNENRLRLARDLLQEEGVILVSIDDREYNRLKELMDEIYGRDNFISTLIWNIEGHTDNQFHIKINHEYNLLYSRNFRNVSMGYVIDPNTRKESNLWKGFAENSITKNGPGNPPSEVNLSFGFPVKKSPLDLDPTNVPEGFFKDVARQGYISRDITRHYSISYPIRKDKMIARDGVLTESCRVFSGWANVRKLQEFIDKGFEPLEESDGKASFYISENGVIYYKKEREKARNILSVLRKMGTTEQMRSEIENMGLNFSYPKPKELIKYLIRVSGVEEKASHIALDFFAGSGTTAHAILDLNKEDNGIRKYVLVEMGDYFDSVMKPRIQKVMYSKDWSNGKPTSTDGVSHMFKYQYLEQYEDSLNNIEFMDSSTVQKTLEDLKGYFLRYMLDFETRDSPTRLNVDKLTRPFEYKLKITKDNETREEAVDLIETFNYLLGLHMKQIRTFKNNGTAYRVVFGEKNNDSIAIIWRNTDDLDLKEDREFIENTVLKDFEAGKVYVNGNSYLEIALPIEPVFKSLMGG